MIDYVGSLAELWRVMISQGHRKRRDGSFYIVKVWDEDHGVFFRARHDGYIAKELEGKMRNTYEQAEDDLIEFLLEQIDNQHHWAKGVLSSGNELELEWNGDLAEHIENTYIRRSAVLKSAKNRNGTN